MNKKLNDILLQVSKAELNVEEASKKILKLFNINDYPTYSDEEWRELVRIKNEHEKFMKELYRYIDGVLFFPPALTSVIISIFSKVFIKCLALP